MLIIYFIALLFTVGRCRDQQILKEIVPVGEDATLTCSWSSANAETLFWIRLVAGNLPEVLAATYTFGGLNKNMTPRITAKKYRDRYVLHIAKTELEDTALYYCETSDDLEKMFLNATSLRVYGPEAYTTAKLDFEGEASSMWSFGDCQKAKTVMFLLSSALTLSFIFITLLIYIIKKNKNMIFNGHCPDSSAVAQTSAARPMHAEQSHMADGDELVYSVTRYTKVDQRLPRHAKADEGEIIYSSVVLE